MNTENVTKEMTPRELAEFAVKTLDAKKARDIKLLRIEDKTVLADYFVICGGGSNTQVRALAGEVEEKLEEMRNTVLPKLRADAAASADPMAGQVVSDFESNVDRFEKKVHDLKISKTIAIQTAPQLRLIQNNDKILVERVQSAIYNAIPLWKNQIVIALGLTRQQNVLKMQQAISDTTNELLKRNAEMLKINSIETAKENNRSIVDIETVKKVNDDLVTTIEETLKIQQEGRQARQSAEQELLQIENRLKETLLANMNR